jgi:hypothetical protein
MSEGLDKERRDAVYSFFEKMRKESQAYMTPHEYLIGCATEYITICQANMINNEIILENIKNMLKTGDEYDEKL